MSSPTGDDGKNHAVTLHRFDAAAALADLPAELTVAGPGAPVRITRDGLGIPHVTAASIEDLCFGQGFATAHDRLWHLEWDRRKALGRTAELIGAPAMVVTDGFQRRARLAEAARLGYALLDGTTRAVLDAHAAGINAFVAATSARPIEFQALGVPDEPWEGWHAVAIFLVRHVTFATWQTKLWNARVLAALGPDAVPAFRLEGGRRDTPVIVPPGTRAAVGALVDAGLFDGDSATAALAGLEPLGLQQSGSNAWAVHGSRTASGLPLIAGDPHRPFEVPNVYYQLRLTGPGVDAAGFSFPGVPGLLHFAQTAHAAWAVTNAMADYQDLFVERLPDALTDVRTERVLVRDGPDVDVECAVTRHGPVVLGSVAHGVGVALASSGLVEAGGSLRTIVPMLQARSAVELDRALADWVEPANNFVLADDAGHIAYRTAGRIPVRHPLNQVLPVPGWTTEHDWHGFIPDGELPRAADPATGAIVTANQRVTTRDYPHLLNDDAYAGHRADRIWTRLGDRTGLTVADQAAIHGDSVNRPGLALAAVMGEVDPDAATVLAGWDGTMGADSPAAALVGLARHHLCALVAAALPAALRTNPFAAWEPPATALPVELRIANAIGHWIADDDRRVLDGRPWPPLVAEATALARAALADGQGWGALHEATPLHPARGLDPTLDALMRPTSGPLAGAADCVMAMNQMGGITTNAMSGSTARYVWDLADRSRSGWTVPLGASGHPASPHFRDQTPDWAGARVQPAFTGDIISQVVLHPAR